MSETTGPHCQAVLTKEADGSCPECGRRLDVPSLHLGATIARRKPGWIQKVLVIAAMIMVPVLIIEAVVAYGRGNFLIALYNSIGLIVIPCVFVARNNLSTFPTSKSPEPSDLKRFSVLAAIGVTLYIGLRYWLAQSGSAAIAGTNTPGHYQNDYFNFQLHYGLNWHDVTDAAVKRAATSQVAPRLMLGLSLPPTDNDATTASLVVTAVKIPASKSGYTSADHLDMMVSNLMKRSDHPRDLKIEKRSTFGGMQFDRLSLKRPWGDQEMGMTFWATQQRGYLILMTGSYPTPEGLGAIEEVLTKMTVAHDG